MAGKDKKKPPQNTKPVPASEPADAGPLADKIGAVAETLKNNKGLAAMFLKKSPLGLLAGAVLATKEGQQLADKAIDKAAEAAGSAFKTASTLAQKAESAIRDTAAEKIADAWRGPRPDGEKKGPKGP